MRRPAQTVFAGLFSAIAISSCDRQTTTDLAPDAQPATLGAIEIDIREETRLTEGVKGATVQLVPASNENWRAPLRELAADSSGHIVLTSLAPERYAVRVWAAGHDTVTERVVVTRGKLRALRVKLRDDHCAPLLTAHGPVCM